MIRFLVAVMLTLGSICQAHDGMENETEIRVRKDRIEITLRSSMVFAWRLLGEKAPPDTSEASLEKAGKELKEIGGSLVTLSSGDAPLKPRSVDCAFELEEHVAFTYVFDVPAGNPPLAFKAAFLKRMSDTEEGTFRLIDLTRDPRRRDVEPLARKRLHRVDDSFSFSIHADGVKVIPGKAGQEPAR
jgi:hypothetical protein